MPHFNTQNIQMYITEADAVEKQAAKAAVAAAVVPHIAPQPVQAAVSAPDVAVQTESVPVDSTKE